MVYLSVNRSERSKNRRRLYDGASTPGSDGLLKFQRPGLATVAVDSRDQPPSALGRATGILVYPSTCLEDIGMSHSGPLRTIMLTYMHVRKVPYSTSGVKRNLTQVIRMDRETSLNKWTCDTGRVRRRATPYRPQAA